jgi:hypothetical protein
MLAFAKAKDAAEFRSGPYALAIVLLHIQLTLGIVSTPSASTGTLRPEIAFVHPVLAVAAARRGPRVAVAGQGHADGGRRSPHRRSGPAAAAGPGIDRGYQRSRVALSHTNHVTSVAHGGRVLTCRDARWRCANARTACQPL